MWADLPQTLYIWCTVDESKAIPIDVTAPYDQAVFDEYDICVTGVAMRHFENRPLWNDLVA